MFLLFSFSLKFEYPDRTGTYAIKMVIGLGNTVKLKVDSVKFSGSTIINCRYYSLFLNFNEFSSSVKKSY